MNTCKCGREGDWSMYGYNLCAAHYLFLKLKLNKHLDSIFDIDEYINSIKPNIHVA